MTAKAFLCIFYKTPCILKVSIVISYSTDIVGQRSLLSCLQQPDYGNNLHVIQEIND